MKSSLFLTYMIIALILSVNSIQNESNTKSQNQKRLMRDISPEMAPKNNDQPGKADKIIKHIDSIGTDTKAKLIKDKSETSTEKPGTAGGSQHKGTANLVVDKFPWKISQCNQIVMFDAQYINNLQDFRKKTNAFFTISIYEVSVFKERDAKSLIHYVPWHQTTFLTKKLRGGLGCLIVDGGSASADVTICLKKPQEAESILNTIEDFRRCRNGDNLVPIPEATMKEMVKQCGKTQTISRNDYISTKLNLALRPDNKWDADRERHFHAREIYVPGTIPPKSEEELRKEAEEAGRPYIPNK